MSCRWRCTDARQAKEAASLAGALPTCQPLGPSKHAEDQPGTERHLGHGSPARQPLPPPPWTVPRVKREPFLVAPFLAASSPSSLCWNRPTVLCSQLQSWEGLAVQLADPEGYFPSYFGNLEDFCCEVFGRNVYASFPKTGFPLQFIIGSY